MNYTKLLSNMNQEIFNKKISNVNLKNELTSLYHKHDDALIVLRIHLISENLLEAWICSKISCEDFFTKPKELRIQFREKLNIAHNLGLPLNIYNFIKELNYLRNNLSHKLEKTNIPIGFSEKIYKKLNESKCQVTLQNAKFGEKEQKIEDATTSESNKLCHLMLLLYIHITIALNPSGAENESSSEKENKDFNIKIGF